MKYFVCSDIHGFYTEWIKALKKKGFKLNNKNHKVIICGDMFDRGHQPQNIIDYILDHKDKFILIRGNHEDLIQNLINRNHEIYFDQLNGTEETFHFLNSDLLFDKFDYQKIAKQSRLQEILDLCMNYYETEHYIFVHGWIPIDEDYYKYDEEWRYASEKRFEKARWANPVEMYNKKIFEKDKTIVCGHWHCSALWHNLDPDKYSEYGPKANFEPFITKEMIAIDACTAYSNKVNVIVIEDNEIDY